MTVTEQDIEAAVERSKREILADIASGRVPAEVDDFGALHDYVDANMYGGLGDDGGPFDWSALEGDEAAMDAVQQAGSEVQERVHRWLVAGRPESISDTLQTR